MESITHVKIFIYFINEKKCIYIESKEDNNITGV